MMTKIYKFIFAVLAIGGMTSCSDFFNQESEHVVFTDQDHLNNATDSIYSVIGILNKLQAIGDRTILLGEVRGDLVDLTTDANSDLRDMFLFNMSDDNRYNKPIDYYAVINNCNYFIAHADTALKNNRNDYIFMKEYAAVKAIRAWTYLQLVLNYGSVPFVTEPIITKLEAEKDYPRYDLQEVCRYFINDLMPLTDRWADEYPGYGNIRSLRDGASRLLFFPMNIVLGDLNLWLASITGDKNTYREAAMRYYKYISQRNGDNSAYPIGMSYIMWTPDQPLEALSLVQTLNPGILRMIPMDRTQNSSPSLPVTLSVRKVTTVSCVTCSILAKTMTIVSVLCLQAYCSNCRKVRLTAVWDQWNQFLYAPKDLTDHMSWRPASL